MAHRFRSEGKQIGSQDVQPAEECGLLQARHRLEFIERLLMRPTPQGIRDAGLLLEEANSLVRQHCRLNETQASEAGQLPSQDLRRMVFDFKDLCSRVNALLEGAQRVQWNRMRAIGAITQSYTATARIKNWKPQAGNVNLHL